MSDLKAIAVAAGFDARLEATELTEFACYVVSDERVLADVNELAKIEHRAPGATCCPDLLLCAVLESWSHGEKAALRNRIHDKRHTELCAEKHEERLRRLRMRARKA